MNNNNNTATLVSHVDTSIVTYDQLKSIVPPASTRYWRPVSHAELVDTMVQELKSRGFGIAKQQFAIGNNGLKLFGTFDLDAKEIVPGVGLAMGFRHSNDKRIAQEIVGGGRVFVCDNMALSGEVTILKQKHLWNYNLRDLIRRGMDAWQRKQSKFVTDIERMQDTPLSTLEAQALLAKTLYDGVTTFQTFKSAYDLYFEKAPRQPEEFADCAPRTAWGLHNAFTRALKLSTPNAAFNGTIELSRVFGLGTEAPTYA